MDFGIFSFSSKHSFCWYLKTFFDNVESTFVWANLFVFGCLGNQYWNIWSLSYSHFHYLISKMIDCFKNMFYNFHNVVENQFFKIVNNENQFSKLFGLPIISKDHSYVELWCLLEDTCIMEWSSQFLDAKVKCTIKTKLGRFNKIGFEVFVI